jgi:hypothetical protein
MSLLVYSLPLSLSSRFDSLYDGNFIRLLVDACTFINIEVWRDKLEPRKNSCSLMYFWSIAVINPFKGADAEVLSGKLYETDFIFL